jgi:hypothetical protein
MQLVKRDPTPSELRTFGIVVFCGFLVIGAALWWLGRAPESGLRWTGSGRHWTAIGLWGLGTLILLLTLLSPSAGRPVYVLWMTGAGYLGTVMTFLLLSVLFVVLLPIFSLIRLKDPLRLRHAAPGASYWEDHRHHESTLERMARPF